MVGSVVGVGVPVGFNGDVEVGVIVGDGVGVTGEVGVGVAGEDGGVCICRSHVSATDHAASLS